MQVFLKERMQTKDEYTFGKEIIETKPFSSGFIKTIKSVYVVE
jgi:hypothetical protein